MRPYFETDSGKLYHGNCLEVMKTFEDDSFDTMITDPPYGLSFMGKKWDYDVPGVDVWKECLRVLKPGATALIFAGTRTQHRMAVNVEDAGFILKDTIMWIYGSGFPKSTDISKQLDKIAGKEREVIGKYQYPDGKPRHKESRAIGTGTIPDYDSHKIRNPPITAPATNEAKTWEGWKSHSLKPAYEPILLCQKPNDGTYAQNALKHGVAGLNIDGGRIETDVDDWKGKGGGGVHERHINKPYDNTVYGQNNSRKPPDHTKGRFPANIILDEEAGRLLDEQSGNCGGKWGKQKSHIGAKNSMFQAGTIGNTNDFTGDKGGASRFFYCAKASKKERGEGKTVILQSRALSLWNIFVCLRKLRQEGQY